MKTKLITALRQTAAAIENGTMFYSWKSPGSCNCGTLFCVLTGQSQADFESRIPAVPDKKGVRDWSERIGYHCPVSGLPTNEMFRQLYGYGLMPEDMKNLEYLSDPKVLARMNLMETEEVEIPLPRKWYQPPRSETKQVSRAAKIKNNKKDHVVAYMRAWADLLTEQGQDDVVQATPAQSFVTQPQ